MGSKALRLGDSSSAAKRYASVGAMTPRLVHDLNNLLSVANGYLELTELEASPGATHLVEVRTAVTQMSCLLRSMRTLMQGNPGQDPVYLLAEWRPALELALGRNITLKLDPQQFRGIPMADQHSLQSTLVCACLQAPALLPAGGVVELTAAEGDDGWAIGAAYLNHACTPCDEAATPLDWWEAAVEFAEASGVGLHRVR